ncbi:cation diffusion facilitator family transporter [Methanoregula formicica]|uniref:Putative Co/Zn/Cd cation transporter n=1 Tax=Methanoregula formicica (strain DSM 22288 / NBRC 105244 / SMSP) TaxID=593750 RepID=L0H9Z7_METFS|nr:cation transporter [Methanoregula formicica]AGB01572.1 putative Co/Zn/Cd cation transporter [Methanoregula formicica SMSP]
MDGSGLAYCGGDADGGEAAATKQKTVAASLGFDILLWVPEIIAFVLSGSITLFADVMKCGNEILATFFALLILIRMRRGDRFCYDYGMGKFETSTRFITGAVMMVSILIITYSALTRIYNPEPVGIEGAMIGIPLMLVTAIIDTYLWQKNYRVSLHDPSPIMESQWRLRRAKAFADVSVLLALVLSFLLGHHALSVYIDPAASFIIIGFLILAGYREISSSLPDIFDKTLCEELQIVILRHLATSYDRYHEFHGVRSRRSGSRIYIEIFLGFDPDQKMGDVQDFIDSLKQSLEAEIPGSEVFVIPKRR